MTFLSAEHDRIYTALRERLLGQPPVGKRSLSRHRLAAEFGVRPGAIRAVLEQMQREGLVEILPKSGARPRILDATEYHEIHDLREIIEAYAARRAAWWITAAQLKALITSCDGQEKLLRRFERDPARLLSKPHGDKSQALNRVFHMTIMAAAHNGTAMRMVDHLYMLDYVAFYARQQLPAIALEKMRATIVHQRAVIAALQAGDGAQAERCMREYMHFARQRGHAGLPLAEQRQFDQPKS